MHSIIFVRSSVQKQFINFFSTYFQSSRYVTRIMKINSAPDLRPKKGKSLETDVGRFKCKILYNEH